MPPLTLFLPNLLYTTADFLCYSVKRATGVAGVGGGLRKVGGCWKNFATRVPTRTHTRHTKISFPSVIACILADRSRLRNANMIFFMAGVVN